MRPAIAAVVTSSLLLAGMTGQAVKDGPRATAELANSHGIAVGSAIP